MNNEKYEGLKAAYELIIEAYKNLQKEIEEAHLELNKQGKPSNGEEGKGKRQVLSLAQRIKSPPYKKVE